ncbi:hypothetical protein RDABS01_036611 [Bienertia sinuspersici]
MSKSNIYSRLHTIFSPTSNASNSIKSKFPNNQIPSLTKPPKSKTPNQSPVVSKGIQDLLDEKDSEKLVEKFKSLSEYKYFRHKYRLYGFVINRLALAKKFSLIEDAIESQKIYATGDGYASRLIYLYGKAGMFEHARKLFDEMPQQKPVQRLKCFSALLGAASNTQQFEKVYELFRELPPKLSIKPNRDSYNIAANALCKLGLLDDALSLLDEMEVNGVEPNVVSYNTILGHFYKKGMFEEGEKLWERMIKSGVVPDIMSYNFKLVGLINDGKLSEAMELVIEVESKGIRPDVGTYNALILKCCKEDDLDGVRKWYKELLTHGCIPNRVTFNTIIPFLCEKGDYGLAYELCKRMFRRQCSVDESLMQKVVDGLAKNSMTEEAKILVGLGRSNTFFPYNLVMPKQGVMSYFLRV